MEPLVISSELQFKAAYTVITQNKGLFVSALRPMK
jgi:hypothetical protein